jgi:hypothetical protein
MPAPFSRVVKGPEQLEVTTAKERSNTPSEASREALRIRLSPKLPPFRRVAERQKLVLSLLSESLEFPSLSVQFSLVGINLSLLFALPLFLALELISNQCSGSQS